MFLSWTVDDQLAALAWQANESSRCSGCGTYEWQWDEDWDAFLPESYVCRGCQRLADEHKKNEKNKVPGLHVRLIPREIAEREVADASDRPQGQS